MSTDDRIDQALSASRVRQGLDRFVSGSAVASTLSSIVNGWRGRFRTQGQTVRSWLARSVLGRGGRAVSRRLGAIADGSRALSGLSRVERWVRSSWLYRWLTAEPDPDVVVIDLRETVTVRPFLAALDESIGLLTTGRRTSVVRRSLGRGWRRFCSSPVRYASLFGLFALFVATATSVIRGTPGPGGFWVRLGLAVVLLAGTRIDRPWTELRDSRPVTLLVAAFEPPEPPGEPARSDDGQRPDDTSSAEPDGPRP
ncbi:MAG: hypothetical protein ACOCPX_08685 [Halapricum sp.]